MITMLNVPKLGFVLVVITAVVAAAIVVAVAMLATAGARVLQSLLEVLLELGIAFNAFPSGLFNFIIIIIISLFWKCSKSFFGNFIKKKK